jgi:hypothetical protein
MRRLLLAVAFTLLAAGPAQAAPEWHSGEVESSWVTNCFYSLEHGITANAQFYADKDALPEVGDTFYVRTIPARSGNGCGINMAVHVEVVLPVGVSLAITPETPVRCLDWEFETDNAKPAEGCPQMPQQGFFGPAFDQETADGPKPWTVAYKKGIAFEIPLRSSRPLKGAAGRPNSCIRIASAPCPAEKAGDNIQLATWVNYVQFHPWLVPTVPLFVEPAGGAPAPQPEAPGGSAPAPAQPGATGTAPVVAAPAPAINKAPASARLRALRRGLPVTVFVGSPGSTVTATLVLKGRTIARATLRRAPAGLNRLRLKAKRAGTRTGTAELRVSVRAADGSVERGTKRIKLKR